VSALKTADTRPTELEGAARLFTGWDFDQQRPDELELIPKALKKRLLDHTLSGGNPENIKLAKRAFGR
ncbi:MAG: hypothetical protein QUS14_05370, partial [Pyrinomonadaceae bacterium]|nr:hypothetical protein [Pyrinomonadaceae bacterium]